MILSICSEFYQIRTAQFSLECVCDKVSKLTCSFWSTVGLETITLISWYRSKTAIGEVRCKKPNELKDICLFLYIHGCLVSFQMVIQPTSDSKRSFRQCMALFQTEKQKGALLTQLHIFNILFTCRLCSVFQWFIKLSLALSTLDRSKSTVYVLTYSYSPCTSITTVLVAEEPPELKTWKT